MPQAFNFPPKVIVERINLKDLDTPIFVDESHNLFIVKKGEGELAEIKLGRSLDSLKAIFKGDGVLFVNPFDEKIMYLSAIDGVYLSENGGKNWEKILERETKIVSMGFNYNGDIFAVLNYSSPSKVGYFISKIENKKDFIESQIDGNNDWLRSSNVFVFNPKDPQQIVVGGLLSKDGGKTFSKMKENLNLGEAVSIDPYDYSNVYTGRSDYSGIFIQGIDFGSSYTRQIYPLNLAITYETFTELYTDIHHKITYAIDNYNALFAFIDSKVFKIARFESDTQLKMEFIDGSNVLYLLPSEGNFYYRVKILGEDKENKNIGVVEANVEIPETSYEVPFANLKSKYVNIKQGTNHFINTVVMSNDAFVYADVESKPDIIILKEALRLYNMHTGNTEVVSIADSNELRFDLNGQVNKDWLLYSTVLQKGGEDSPPDVSSLKIYAYNRKSQTIKLLLQFSDIEKIYSENLKENLNFDIGETKFAILGDTVFVAINGSISENISGRINYLNSCVVIFKVDLSLNSKSIVFKEVVPIYDARIITEISANPEYMAFSYAGQDDEIVYLYSLKNKSLNKILEARGYNAIFTEDNNLMFEDNGVVYIASIENLDKKTPIILEDTLSNCVASSNYIAYPHNYEVTYLANGTKTYAYLSGTEIYNRATHKKSLIKDCSIYNAFINEDTLIIFNCDSKNPNRLYSINLKENGF